MKRVFIACAALVSMMMVACNTPATTTTTESIPATELTPATPTTQYDLAYVDVDAVLAQSDIFQTEGVALQTKTTNAQKSWSQKEQNLQSEMTKLQEKYQRGLITTTNAQTQQEKIQSRIASYQSTAQAEARKLDEENVVFSNRTRDLLMRAVQQINADKKYKMIVNASSLIDADTTLNITPRVLEVVNELYAAEKEE